MHGLDSSFHARCLFTGIKSKILNTSWRITWSSRMNQSLLATIWNVHYDIFRLIIKFIKSVPACGILVSPTRLARSTVRGHYKFVMRILCGNIETFALRSGRTEDDTYILGEIRIHNYQRLVINRFFDYCNYIQRLLVSPPCIQRNLAYSVYVHLYVLARSFRTRSPIKIMISSYRKYSRRGVCTR